MYRCLIWFDLRTGHCFSNRGMESRPHPRFNQGIDSKMTALEPTEGGRPSEKGGAGGLY